VTIPEIENRVTTFSIENIIEQVYGTYDVTCDIV